MTCIEFGRAEIRTQVGANISPYGHPTQIDCKLIMSQLYMREVYGLFATWVNYNSVWPPIASPWASSGFANLRQLDRFVSPFGHGLESQSQPRCFARLIRHFRLHGNYHCKSLNSIRSKSLASHSPIKLNVLTE